VSLRYSYFHTIFTSHRSITMSQKTFTLLNGARVPTLGYGTWQAAPGEVKAGVAKACVACWNQMAQLTAE
jgi:hypothetical protein